MAEVGIDITAEEPKILTTEAVQASDVVITMGCGDACPFFPGKRYQDWKLDDPAGQGIEAVRRSATRSGSASAVCSPHSASRPPPLRSARGEPPRTGVGVD